MYLLVNVKVVANVVVAIIVNVFVDNPVYIIAGDDVVLFFIVAGANVVNVDLIMFCSCLSF